MYYFPYFHSLVPAKCPPPPPPPKKKKNATRFALLVNPAPKTTRCNHSSSPPHLGSRRHRWIWSAPIPAGGGRARPPPPRERESARAATARAPAGAVSPPSLALRLPWGAASGEGSAPAGRGLGLGRGGEAWGELVRWGGRRASERLCAPPSVSRVCVRLAVLAAVLVWRREPGEADMRMGRISGLRMDFLLV